MGVSYESCELHVDGVRLEKIAKAVGTPLFVYSGAMLKERLARLKKAFAPLAPKIRYAVKANSNGAILKLLLGEGAGFDIVSGGELLRTLRIGAQAKDLVFAGVGKQEWELRLALEKGIGLFNVESEAELVQLRELAKELGRPARIALRLNPDVDANTHEYIATGKRENKFGISFDLADQLLPLIHDEKLLSLVAYHVHLGSLLLEPGPYLEAAARVMAFMDEDEGRRRGVKAYDMGGGFGIRDVWEESLDVETLGLGMQEILAPRKLSILLEPGRFLVGNSAVLVARVIQLKRGKAKNFLICDAGMTELIRPALYHSEHVIRPVVLKESEELLMMDVVGPICESADFLGQDRQLRVMEAGELVAIMNAGAYGFSMASNYNSRPLAAEVLCTDGEARLIRQREPMADLWRHERDEAIDFEQPGL